MMEQNLQQTTALLAHTPAALDALLRDLPEEWSLQNEGEDTWTAFDVVGHLVHCEQTDWMSRAKIILDFGESRTFDPLNRSGHIEASRGKSLNQLLEEFSCRRAENLRELSGMNLQPADLARRGNHPAFGAVTLSALLAAWAVHDLTHLHQLSRILAYQYREAVGPWKAYLGVLKCAGHSS